MKSIYLDQLHWIKLGRSLFGKESVSDVLTLIGIIERRLDAGAISLFLSSINMMEFARASDLKKRKRLAEVFVKLSRGRVLKNRVMLVKYEIINALSVLFPTKNIETIPISPFGEGVFDAFGGDARFVSALGLDSGKAHLLKNKLREVKGWLDFLRFSDEHERKKAVHMMTDSSTVHIRKLEGLRVKAQGNYDLLKRAYIAILHTNLINGLLQKILFRVNIGVDEFHELSAEKLIEFYSNIPTLNIEIELTVESIKQRTRALQNNDLYDIAALATAIPYCDIVITEAFWKDLVSRRKLDEKYRTILLSKLTELTNHI